MADRAPFPTDPEEFKNDDRVLFDQVSQTHRLEDERGEEWEWLDKPGKWVPVTDEAMMARQQEAYKVAGVDEDAPAVDLRKRKAAAAEEEASNGKAKKQKSDAPRKSNAVYVTSLPDDVTEDELQDVFSKYGVIAESAESNKPRIKLYVDDKGDFKGDALIVYFRSESVELAITMLDETDFRMGQKLATGPMRVTVADSSYKSQKEKPLASEQAKTKGTGANRDRNKVLKKNQEMNNRLADWDDDDDNPSALPDTSSRWDKVVVLKRMFTPQLLAEDADAISDITEDVREEAEKCGSVSNVTLYDKEEDGVVTVRFANAMAATACAKQFAGRMFDGVHVEAYIADGTEKFKKSKKKDAGDEDEEKRLEGFGNFIEADGA
ncbi:hypothetical protein LTR37_000737 [Vermiconidia calcicola]|uniref:Uncharacterized protein n=1 Tax=Vermiconidia calcicola TaxID=1690605 RepID=A0ACC3NYI5_9PEZI|nr:hypothetical protein LTR37_000737 [Vermiconidia calcicola]